MRSYFLSGYLDFDVDVKFTEGLWSGTAESWVEMNIKLTFY